jgi:SAM-dependent methyltransferase
VQNLTGREFFAQIYETDLEQEAMWLRHCARAKVDSIEYLLARCGVEPQSLVELGAGTGAVIEECVHRALARRFCAVDFSATALAYLRKRVPDVEIIQADIASAGFHIEDEYDVVVISHVLEHLEDPIAFLRSVRKAISFKLCIIEVPLENMLGSRLKALFRPRIPNEAGHVQFFDSESFIGVVTDAGLTVLDRFVYIPILTTDARRFVAQRHHWSWRQSAIRTFTGGVLPRVLSPLWKRFYYAHCAVAVSA